MVLRGVSKRFIIPMAIVLLMVALVGVLAAGCGSSSTTTTTVAPETTTTAAPETTTTVGESTTTTAPAPTTTAALSASLNGAGATFPQPVYVAWIGAFQSLQPGVKINYQGVGSGAGITQFTAQTLDFGASDAFMKDTEIAAAVAARPGAQVLQIPTVFGSITLAYNLPDLKTPLKLDSDTLCNILLGKITKWNDPAIAALNAGATLPSTAIQTVHRSDSSGTTNAFTSYLAAVNAAWKAGPGVGKTVKWPNGVGGTGNAGVAALISQTKGAIGYVELAYALSNNMTVAQMKNSSGNFITPSLDSTTAAADLPSFPATLDLLPVVSNSSNPQAYPIVTSTYILAYDKMPDAAKAAALKAFITWALGPDGTAIAKGLGYAPLPAAIQTAALAKVNAIGS
jgi:phosphate transport system substrate-binding protein